MFKPTMERGTGEARESEPSIKELKGGMENTSLPLEERIKAADALIERYRAMEATTKDVVFKIDRAEAETLRAQLVEDQQKGEIDLDFTKPQRMEGVEVTDYSSVEEKIEEEKRRIEAAERGIKLARAIGDDERVRQLEQHIMKFQETIELLQPERHASGGGGREKPLMETRSAEKASNDSAFDDALRGTGEGAAADRLDAARKRAR